MAALTSLTVTTPASAVDVDNAFTADHLPTWQTNGTVWALASAKGKVFAGGNFSNVYAPGTAEGSAGSKSITDLVVLHAATGVLLTTAR